MIRSAVLGLGLVALLSGCVDGTDTATTWSGASYLVTSPYGFTRVSSRRNAYASIAHYGTITSVSTAAGGSTGSTVATDGTTTGVSTYAGGAEAALGTSGNLTAISTSTSNASASVATDGTMSSGTTSAGTATSSW